MNSGPPSSTTANNGPSGVGGAEGGANNDADDDAAGKEGQGLVTVLNGNDVLFGRGAPVIDNEGNMRFRQMVQSRRAEYLASARRQEKDWIARQVMAAIKNRGGRFLRKVDTTSTVTEDAAGDSQPLDDPPQGSSSAWSHVDEEAVLLKVKQAMRDRSLEDEEPRPRRRRRVRSSNNVVLEDEDQSIEEEKRAAQRPRVEEGSSQQQQPLLPPVLPNLQLHQPQSQAQQQQANLVELLLQQRQQLQGQEETRMLAELQRQQHERSSLAQLIEEHRLRNSLQDVLQRGALGGTSLAGLRDIPSLGGGGGIATGGTTSTASANMSGLSDIATLARLYSLTQQGNLASPFQPALNMATGAGAGGPAALFGTNRDLSSAAAYLCSTLSNLEESRLPLASNTSAPLGAGSQGDRKGEESKQASSAATALANSASLGGHTGQAYGPMAAAAAVAAARRTSSAASSQASSTAQQQEATNIRLKPGFRLDSSQPSNDERLHSTSGELAIEQAFHRMENNPVGALQEQHLKLSLIEGCLLSVVCSIGIPQWTERGMDSMGGMVASSSEDVNSQPSESHTAKFSWLSLARLVKEKLDKLKNGNRADESLSALASTAISNPRLTSGAAILSVSLMKDPTELARMTIMLLEKIRIHSRIAQQTQDSGENFLYPSNASSRRCQAGEGHDSDDDHGTSSAPATDKDNAAAAADVNDPATRSPLLWHLLAELGRWATSLNVESEGTGHPIAHSMFDLTPRDLAEEEVMAPVAALDMMSCRKILAQTACLSRLRAIFQRQSSQDIVTALKQIATTTPTMTWASRPSWWLLHNDIWLLENIVHHGLDAILYVPTSSRSFPVSRLRDAGLTKAAINDRAVQLTIAVHEQIQGRKRVQVEQERSNKLSAMMTGTIAGGTSASA